jgi:drug/metabolite transporter (DMT)-like permease
MAVFDQISPRHAALPFLALLAGGFAVGFSPIFVKLADVGPLASGFYRMALALPALWVLQGLTAAGPSTASAVRPRDTGLLLMTGLVFAADIMFWHLSLFYTSVADATLLSNTAPIMVAAGAFLIFNERVKPLFIAGLAMAIAGVAALALQKVGGAEPIDRLLGDGLAMGAAVSYACYLLLVSRLRRNHGTARIVLATTVVSALALLPLAYVSSTTMWPQSREGWAILVAMALVSHVGGQTSLTYALAHLPAAYSSMTQLMQAVIAGLAAWVILGEALTPLKLLSGAVILAGIFMCGAARRR